MKLKNTQTHRNKNRFIGTTTITIAATAVAATYAPTAEAATFKDVPANHYANEAITYMAANKIINGYPDNTYRLNQPVTRAQAAKMIALAIKANPSNAYKLNFTDVTPTHGAYDHIRALTEKGLFANQTKFNPNAPLTRGQMAKLLVLGYNIITDDNDFIRFADVTKSNGAYAHIITIAELNITTTRPGTHFKPNEPVTRAQMAAFLHRTIEFDNKRAIGLITYDKQKKMYVDNQQPSKPTTPKPEEPKPEPPKPEPPVTQPSLAAQTIINVNAERKAAKVSSLQADPALNKIAAAKAEDMAKHGELSHTSPTYGTVPEMLAKFNYKWKAYGENIAAGYISAKGVTDAWLASPGHKENLLSPTFTHMGAGTATDKNGKIYWVNLYSKK
ncbi:S-layer associated protein [Sporosarcina newyorkensis 2681]|uniref:S-layer associated protein n=1 Tax=Sporosarcina newyorkensis 2681 TaxID=1027292 RepID=F9DR70_9BACL|nr:MULTISPECIES: S-layer homology domain-containing protein [Sporosarcina]EGQ26613.1 S-layer associated protein [Sporosarcina newyorkensis 2681]MBY0221099.1 S-layer homology domain-containing protein [Sporosarcina aquimarina]